MEYYTNKVEQSAELRISDCSSEDDHVYTETNNKESKTDENASVYISWSSEDELGVENYQSLLNRSLTNPKLTKPGTNKRPSSARKSKLPNVLVKRKRSILSQPKIILTNRTNVPLTEKTSNHQSAWCKVRKTFSTLRFQRSFTQIVSSFANNHKTPTTCGSTSHKCDETPIEWSSSSSESGSPKRMQLNITSLTQTSTAPTELEIPVALVEREARAPKTPHRPVKIKQKRKRFTQGGYAERLQKLEEANRIERNFLQHDQQLGLQNGIQMRVVELNEAYGMNMAKVELDTSKTSLASDFDDKNAVASIRIIIDADMAAHVKVGSKMEAFFDTNIKPYTIKNIEIGSNEIVYVQPHKLLLL